MKRSSAAALAVCMLLPVLASCQRELQGDPRKYALFDSTDDCLTLQALFDDYSETAWNKALNGAADSGDYTAYVSYLNDRINDLDCYG